MTVTWWRWMLLAAVLNVPTLVNDLTVLPMPSPSSVAVVATPTRLPMPVRTPR